MTRTAINLYTVRAAERPMREILDTVAAAGYDVVKLAGGIAGLDVPAVDLLGNHDLAAAAAHVGVEGLEDDLDAEHLESSDAVKATVGRLNVPGSGWTSAGSTCTTTTTTTSSSQLTRPPGSRCSPTARRSAWRSTWGGSRPLATTPWNCWSATATG
ncbi:hypothetical protein [Halorhabdus amylolytica]|uniref:hypothetical protein n=1 Tax=Halorhabdus amylolytica TaxID=2559573 RepID=UPI0020BF0365|nr:hypothetical protein [Halorhabdus amylolytica]